MHAPIIEIYPIGLLGSNVYLIYTESGGDAAIVDPGFRDVGPIQKALSTHALRLRIIINTHGHFDHVAGNQALKRSDVELAIHPDDRDLLRDGGGGPALGYFSARSPEPSRYLEDGDEIQIGPITLRVIHTPGHTPGSLCLYHEKSHKLLTGDTLFAGSIGRTDLPGGNAYALKQSLKRLAALPEQTEIYPGHGPSTRLADELKTNPWLQD